MNFADLWCEFFTVEPVTARMVNNIAGQTLNDVPLNVYLYVLAVLAVSGWVLYDLYRGTKPAWQAAGKKALIIIFVLWSLMEVRSSFNYLTYARNDHAQFSGRSLEQKHDLTAPPGLYGFTRFVKQEVPPDKSVALIFPPNAYYELKMYYHMHPVKTADPAHADYVAGYMVYPKNARVYKYSKYGWIIKR